MTDPERPSIALIIPVYNGEAFLAQAIESALSQTWPAGEIAVVDDGSDDRSAAIAAGYDVMLIQRENAGPYAAMNDGLRATSGDPVAFLDADDVMLPRKLELQARYLVAHPEAGGVMCAQEIFIEGNAVPPGWVPTALRDGVPPPPMSMMVRRDVFARVGYFREDLRISGDLDLLMRMRAENILIHRLDEVLLRRRVHDNNLTHNQHVANTELLQSIRQQINRQRGTKGTAL